MIIYIINKKKSELETERSSVDRFGKIWLRYGSQVIRLEDIHFNVVNVLVYAIMSEWFKSLHPGLFLAFPVRVLTMRIMVSYLYCHVFSFVTTDIKLSPTDTLIFLVFMVKQWLLILLWRSPISPMYCLEQTLELIR